MHASAPRLLFALTLVCSLPLAGHAQQDAPQATFRARVDVVTVAAVVRDKNGRPVPSLSRDDFTVFDGGTARPILEFQPASNGPVSIALLLDASGSMRLVDATGNFPMVGVEYDEIALDASLAGNAFQLTEMRLQTGDGSMTATGQATLTPLANPGFDFEAQFDRFTLARTALLRSRVDSGGVRMSGTLEATKLAMART